jgi:hypothetical protein
MMKLNHFLLPLACLALQACHLTFDEKVYASGVDASDVRPLVGFDRISVAGGFDVNVSVGGAARVELSGDEHLMSFIETAVDGNELKIYTRDGYSLERYPDITIELPRLSGFEYAGRSEVEIAGIESPEFELEVAGSVQVRATGNAGRTKIEIAGSADVEFFELVSEHVEVDIAGSADVNVHARKTLDVSVAGSGRVTYRGSPEVSHSIAGSGKVKAEARTTD